MSDKVLLGKRIKEFRKSKGITQEVLSEMVGIDSKHMSRIECGVNFPSLDLLLKISKALNIESYLLFQTMHLKSKEMLLDEINKILHTQSDENVRTFYKILMDIIT